MFFGYPIAATAENWLHSCVCEIVMIVHACIEAGEDIPGWPDVVPAEYRLQLQSRLGLRDRIYRYAEAARELSGDELEQVELCLIQQNDITSLLDCTGDCDVIADLPEEIGGPSEDLFTFSFRLLSDLGIRDEQYRQIYKALSYAVCPFCGSEYFDSPTSHREDFDHYLARTIYPFAAANLRNLSPMGKKCNGYKLQKDMLRDAAGDRRRAFDPYGEVQVTVSLINSVPFGGPDDQTPRWHVEFNPDSPECVTWDAVFSNKSFGPWLAQFAAWFRNRIGLADLSDNRLLEGIREHRKNLSFQGFKAREFLCVRVFEMLEFQDRKSVV